MKKRLLDNGHKARQRIDHENRAWEFSDALRRFGVSATDMDFIASYYVIEHTLASKPITEQYRESIDFRRIERDGDDKLIAGLAKQLHRKAILVTHKAGLTDSSFVWYRAITGHRMQWRTSTLAEFMNHLKTPP